MDAKDIERYLSLVGAELQAMNVQESIQLLLIGGGYMLTQVRNRSATGDVDAMFMDTHIYSDSEVYRLFQAAVQFVANDEALEPAWLSTDIGDFLRTAGPLPKVTLWKKFGPLHVYIPPKQFILAHKLLAGREKDRDDIDALCHMLGINTHKKAQKILDSYIRKDIQDNSDVAATLEDFFG
jgi:hypothetical protein